MPKKIDQKNKSEGNTIHRCENGDGNWGRENRGRHRPQADASTMDERTVGTPYWVAEDKITSSGRKILGQKEKSGCCQG